MYECEKHPLDREWTDEELGDRIIGWLSLRLIIVTCLQYKSSYRHPAAAGQLPAVPALSALLHPVDGPAAQSADGRARAGGEGDVASRARAHPQSACTTAALNDLFQIFKSYSNFSTCNLNTVYIYSHTHTPRHRVTILSVFFLCFIYDKMISIYVI